MDKLKMPYSRRTSDAFGSTEVDLFETPMMDSTEFMSQYPFGPKVIDNSIEPNFRLKGKARRLMSP